MRHLPCLIALVALSCGPAPTTARAITRAEQATVLAALLADVDHATQGLPANGILAPLARTDACTAARTAQDRACGPDFVALTPDLASLRTTVAESIEYYCRSCDQFEAWMLGKDYVALAQANQDWRQAQALEREAWQAIGELRREP